jgi:hypothetical protein
LIFDLDLPTYRLFSLHEPRQESLSFSRIEKGSWGSNDGRERERERLTLPCDGSKISDGMMEEEDGEQSDTEMEMEQGTFELSQEEVFYSLYLLLDFGEEEELFSSLF